MTGKGNEEPTLVTASLCICGREISPPEYFAFAMGKQTRVELVDRNDQRRTVAVDVARHKGKKLHFIEPILVEARQFGDGPCYLKIAMFPGMIGVEVANEISHAVEKLGTIDCLIIDPRGNTGGGIGAPGEPDARPSAGNPATGRSE